MTTESFVFKKPKKNFRSRGTNPTEEDGSDREHIQSSMGSSSGQSGQMKVKKKDKEKASLLSFADEEEEADTEVFRVKKSKESRKLSRELKKTKKVKDKKDEEVQEQDDDRKENEPEGDEEGPYTLKIKVNPLPNEASTTKHNSMVSGLGEYTEEKLKKLRAEMAILNGQDAEDVDDEESGFKELLRAGSIPDAKTIYAARKKRQLAREMGDFIPLEEQPRVTTGKSRLVREDDNDRSDEEGEDEGEEGRLSFNVRASEEARRQRDRENFLAYEEGSDNEEQDDEELAMWEQQQIRKGVNIAQAPPQTGDEEDDDTPSGKMDPIAAIAKGFRVTAEPMELEVKPVVIPEQLPPITVESLKSKLKERLESLKSVHQGHRQEYESMKSHMSLSKDSSQQMDESRPDLDKKYAFYQDMRGFVYDLIECLGEKLPAIDALENQVMALLKKRADKLVARRREDMKDEGDEYSLMRVSSGTPKPGGDPSRVRRTAEREARRSRRRYARELSDSKHNEGMSSDDEESPSEIVVFRTERERLLTERDTLTDDVIEDFSKVESIAERFSDWKKNYNSSYSDAYIGLCLPKLLSPLVRLQLVGWNPLLENAVIENTAWFNTLVFYGAERSKAKAVDASNGLEKEDEDDLLIPTVIEKTLLTRLIEHVNSVYDPLSSSQTRRLVCLIEKLVESYPTINSESKNTEALLKAVLVKIKKSVEEDVYIPLYPKQLMLNKMAAHYRYFKRQLFSCIKLFENIVSWHTLYSSRPIIELAVDGLLNRYLTLAMSNLPLDAEGVAISEKVVSSLPQKWFEQLKDDKTFPHLEPLCRYMLYAADTLNSQMETATDVERRQLRLLIKSIRKQLLDIHALNHAEMIAKKFNV